MFFVCMYIYIEIYIYFLRAVLQRDVLAFNSQRRVFRPFLCVLLLSYLFSLAAATFDPPGAFSQEGGGGAGNRADNLPLCTGRRFPHTAEPRTRLHLLTPPEALLPFTRDGENGGRVEGWRDGGRVEGWRAGGGLEGGWRDGGRVEGWRDGGRVEGWRDGGVEGWRAGGGMEGWRAGGGME